MTSSLRNLAHEDLKREGEGEKEREGEEREGEGGRGGVGEGRREEGFTISGSGSISNYPVISSKQRILHAANTRDFHQPHDLSVGTELKTITPARAEHPVSY